MGVPQMYYTSCESGLAGYPGFQFNAATPGVPGAVLRRVEQATSYEPPRSLGYEPTAEQLAATPVNLCYQPGTGGEPAILAHTVFIGNDYSQRFGNYFVHALSLGPDDLAGARPIDFWAAGFWARAEVPFVELPELEPVPSQAFDPEGFLRAGREGMVPKLLTAVERAIVTGDRPVIVVAEETAEVAHWIAVLCELLPPAMVARFAFATYQYRPGRGREHLVGTVPTSDFTVTESALRSFAVFDLAGGSVPGGDEHPLAELLTAAGTADARYLWDLAGDLAAGPERDFDGWYPVVVAAALCARLPVDDGDLAAVLAWLPGNADRLSADTVTQIVEECLDHEALTLPQCLALVGVAADLREPDLQANTEVRAFEMLLRDPASTPADVPRLATVDGRRYARQQVTTRLGGAAPGMDTVAVLSLAARTRVELTDDEWEDYGHDLIAPLLLDDPRPPRVLRSVPALRRGLLRGLAEAQAARKDDVRAAAIRLAGDSVPEEEFAAHPPLQRLLEVSRAAGDPSERIPALIRLSASGPPERSVVAALWPHGWDLAEAAAIVREVPEKFEASDGMLGLLNDVLARPEIPAGSLRYFVPVGRFGARPEVVARLSVTARTHVTDLERCVRLFHDAKDATGTKLSKVVAGLVEEVGRVTPPAGQYLDNQLPDVLIRLDGAALAELLPKISPELRRAYRRRLVDSLRRSADLGLAAHTLEAFHLLTGTRPEQAAELDEALTASVARWKPRDLDTLEKVFTHSKVDGLAEHVTQWRAARAPRRRGFLPRLR
ncbi:GTPase-associated protein 1-related protein [Actinoplanes sp. NPDC020271]|uniref:GTPase-associated protein 1-related protein n=1 Tax=Actinoplanes sp. NPDC020271 TaxID=3363896 RepID=UPI0037AAA996